MCKINPHNNAHDDLYAFNSITQRRGIFRIELNRKQIKSVSIVEKLYKASNYDANLRDLLKLLMTIIPRVFNVVLLFLNMTIIS